MLPALRFLGILLLGAAPLLGDGEFIPLLDGEILVGEIASHDEEGIEVKRLDTGGVVRLRWTQLAPPFERALRAKLGYTYEAAEEVLVEADEITFADGTKRVGRIIDQDAERIVLKDPKSTLAYQRIALVGTPARVRVPALDVFTKDELYAEKLASVDATTAQGNLELARYLEQIQDFGRAIQHLGEVKRLDPSFHPGEVSQGIARLEDKKARQDEYDYLREVEAARSQRHWDRAIALCDGFAPKFPKAAAATRADVERRKKSAQEMKQKDMLRRTFDEVHRAAERLARGKSSDRKVGLETAKNYTTNEMKREVFNSAAPILAKEFSELNEQEAQKLWGTRGKLPKVRSVSYGSGTFVLGKDAARRGLDLVGGTKAAAPSSEEAEMAKKLKRLIERQQGGGAGQPGQKKLEPSEEWWQLRASGFERYQFLLAYFVENGGIMEVVGVQARQCPSCGGRGVIPVTNIANQPGGVQTGGGRGGNQGQQSPSGSIDVECAGCRGVGFERVVLYR